MRVLQLLLAVALHLQTSAAIEVAVSSDSGPVPGAQVVVSGNAIETGLDGRVTIPVPPGREISRTPSSQSSRCAGRLGGRRGSAASRSSGRRSMRDQPQFSYVFNVPGLFVQDDIELKPWLTLSASGRLDVQSEFGTLFSPRVSALLRHAGWTTRASVGTGFFAPTALTEETQAAGLARLTVEPIVRHLIYAESKPST
jgi:hypothetical protein